MIAPMWMSVVLRTILATSGEFDQSYSTLRMTYFSVLQRDHKGVGSYKFGYNTGLSVGQSFREEEKTPNGTVFGKWGYVDPFRVLRITEYRADDSGFHIVARHVVSLPEPRIKPPRPVSNPPGPFIGPLPPFVPRPPPVEDE
ncbi:uncharacterized protein LOC111089672 [Limulus polyphemus]|uniref:Uncharacterized protein LOC111089672 n=1 Tax=Limulus polyphemus TaxID=6850 RepID=A0ABM1TQZ6_LIMPO|nr:uncharacterized protein LOC111089672 [Limulus polyphemus]